MAKVKNYLKSIPLYTKIFIGFLVGALIGPLLKAPTGEINITHKFGDKSLQENIKFDQIYFVDSLGTSFSQFGHTEIGRAIKYFETSKYKNIKVVKSNKSKVYSNIIKLEKPRSLSYLLKPIGTLFMKLLSFLAIPLVLVSLIVGAASLEDVRKLERIGLRTLVLFISTTAIAIIIGLVLTNLIEPGKMLSEQSKVELFEEYTPPDASKQLSISIADYIVDIVPKNPFSAIASGEMLQIVFIAVFFGIALNLVPREHSVVILTFFNSLNVVMLKLVDIVMAFAPIGVFALIAATFADFGFDILVILSAYAGTVLLGLLLQVVIVYVPIIKFLGKRNPKEFFMAMREAWIVAFTTSSSAATLPVTMRCVEEKLGVEKKISSFVLPLGATINMDGTALYQGVATVFIAQVYGMDLTLSQQITVVLTAVLASIGTAPVPGVGILMLVMILNSVNVPAQGIALIIGIDRLLDMCRTVPNITGDASVAVAIAKMAERKQVV